MTREKRYLWASRAPGARGETELDRPSLDLFIPDDNRPVRPAMVICPGGGYAMLADHEGKAFAEWLNGFGVAGFVLNYRLGSSGYRHPAMLEDVSRAVRLVRCNAAAWRVDPSRIGVMGSSAGGHLASTLMTHFDAGTPGAEDPVDRYSSRPDLGVLCYPVISMSDRTHQGSKDSLLGLDPDPRLVESLSNERQVTSRTPPFFIWHTMDDTCVDHWNSIAFAEAARDKSVACELHLYPRGGHGMGLGADPFGGPGLHPWTEACLDWLRTRRFLRDGGSARS